MQTKIGGQNILSISLLNTGRGYNKEYRAGYNKYRVLIFLDNKQPARPIEDIFSKEELKKLSYWSTRSDTMSMQCWGTSQPFEAQLALASFFNMKKEGEEWGDYCRRVKELIHII